MKNVNVENVPFIWEQLKGEVAQFKREKIWGYIIDRELETRFSDIINNEIKKLFHSV